MLLLNTDMKFYYPKGVSKKFSRLFYWEEVNAFMVRMAAFPIWIFYEFPKE